MAPTLTKNPPHKATARLHKFVSKRNKVGRRLPKPKLTPENYEVGIKKLNGAVPLASRDADITKQNITGICQNWKR